MRISISSWLLAASLAIAGGAASTQADEGSVLVRGGGQQAPIIADEINVIEPDLRPTFAPSEVGNQLVSSEVGSGEVGSGLAPAQFDESSEYAPTSVGSDFYTATERGAGIIGGGELVFMRPYASLSLPDLEFKAAYRAWIGYQNEEGLGARLRYFSYDQSRDFFGLETYALEFQQIDAELTQQVDYYSWNFLVSGGVRQAESRFAIEIPSPLQAQGVGFSGTGLTFSTQATRDLNSSGSFRFLAGARWSTIFGNSRYEVNHVVSIPAPNTTLNILEIQAGPQFVRELDNGALLTIFGGVETQSWSGVVGFGDTGISLLGFGSSVSILR